VQNVIDGGEHNATQAGQIAGLIGFRPNSHAVLLFVTVSLILNPIA
jgi:hypothetical protein